MAGVVWGVGVLVVAQPVRAALVREEAALGIRGARGAARTLVRRGDGLGHVVAEKPHTSWFSPNASFALKNNFR